MKITGGTASVIAHGFYVDNGSLVVVCTDGSLVIVDIQEDALSSLFEAVETLHE